IRSLLNPISNRAADKNQWQGGKVHQLTSGLLLCAMPRCDMGDLVRHDTGEFSLVISGQNQTTVDVEKTARQSEGIDFIGLDDLDCKRNSSVRVANNILTYPVYIFIDDGIFQEPLFLLNLLRKITAQCYFLIDGDKVDTAFVDIAGSNVFDVGVFSFLTFGGT